MDFIWWEKTVEYLFVQKYIDIKTVIAPIGGQAKGGGATSNDFHIKGL